MKKTIFTLLVAFIVFNVNAQIDREKVLLEIATGTWCVYCPGAAMGADDLHANGDPVAIIENHNGDSFTTPDSDARNSYYSVSGYPTANFDGMYNQYVGGNANTSLYGTYLPIVNARMAIQTAFDIEITGSNDGDDYDVNVNVEKVGEYSNETLKVRFALTESHIPYNWFVMSECNFVNRLMIPNAAGTEVTLSDVGDEVDVD